MAVVGAPPPHPKQQPRTHAIFSKSESPAMSDNLFLTNPKETVIIELPKGFQIVDLLGEEENNDIRPREEHQTNTHTKWVLFSFISHFEPYSAINYQCPLWSKSEQVPKGKGHINPPLSDYKSKRTKTEAVSL